jgi:hypothetical protein
MLAGLSVTVLLCGQFEQVYEFEEKKNPGFALLRLKFLVISMNGIDSTKSLQFMKSLIACL